MKIILYNLFFIVPLIFIGYCLYIRDIKSEKTKTLKKGTAKNVYKLAIFTLPIYICVILNVVTGLPFYLTMIASVLIVYLLSDKKDFIKTILNSISWHTIIMITAILLIKEIILQMDELLLVFNNLFAGCTNMTSVLLILFIASVLFGFITGNQGASLAIVLPMISQLEIFGEMIYIYVFFTFASAYIGYYFSPVHLCQAFTIQQMNTSTKELYKEYKLFLVAALIILVVSIFVLKFIFI